MSTSIEVQLADAVTEAINSASPTLLPPGVQAQRTWRPIYSLSTQGQLQVYVCPSALELTNAARGVAQSEITIDVGVLEKLPQDPGDLDERIGQLGELANDIAMLLLAIKTPLAADCFLVSASRPVMLVPEHLTSHNQFTSFVRVVFRRAQRL